MDPIDIVNRALHDVKYPNGVFGCAGENDSVWPKHSDAISGDPIITESDLEVLLEVLVQKIIDEVSDRIGDLRIR
jgi:hypothetical protein